MRVYFVTPVEQAKFETSQYSYDDYMDSKLFATRELAEKEADQNYSDDLNSAAENYQKRVARYEARRDIQNILNAHNPELLEISFPYGFMGEFPEFEEPKRRFIYYLEVVE